MSHSFTPIAAPRVMEQAYSEDQHRRMLEVIRREGRRSLMLARPFKSPEEVVATPSATLPVGFKASGDLLLSPVFRGYFGKGMTTLDPETENCFLNRRFLDLARDYWGATYARAENMLFNLQGPCAGGESAKFPTEPKERAAA